MHAKVRQAAPEVRDGIEHEDVRGRELGVVECETGKEIEEALENRDHAAGRPVGEDSIGVDGGDPALGGGLEAGRGLEGVSAGVVGKADVVIGPVVGLAPKGNLPAVAHRDPGRNAP